MEEESNEDEAGSDVDSLSDLYPGSISSTNVVQSVGVCVLHHWPISWALECISKYKCVGFCVCYICDLYPGARSQWVVLDVY